MYERFYEFERRPFDLTPDPKDLLVFPSHAEALGAIGHGLASRKGIILLLGEAGTGKTTLLRAVRDSLGSEGRLAILSNPTLTRAEFFEFVAEGFKLSTEKGTSKVQHLRELVGRLDEFDKRGLYPGLVVDEAHRMPYELLDEIHLLTNTETKSGKLFPVILSGQPELGELLNETRFRQIKQRVGLRCKLPPLSVTDTASYIAGRIRLVGGRAIDVFSREAVSLIHRRSRGIPRTINVIADNALVSGFAAQQKPVTELIVEEVCRDLDFARDVSGSSPGRAAGSRSRGPAPTTRATSTRG